MTDNAKNDKQKNEGEGNKTADRQYREGVRRHIESGAVAPAAKEAERAVDSEAGDELRRAAAAPYSLASRSIRRRIAR